MFENHFYNESTRRMVSVFGSIFNDLEVVKKDSAGKILQKIKVPLSYAPRSKVLARLNEQTTDPNIALKLPRMSFEISSFEYDANARVSKHKNYKKVIVGDEVVFDGSNSIGLNLNYYWSFGDIRNKQDEGESINFRYVQGGIKVVTLNVTDIFGNSAINKITVEVTR